MHSPKDPKLPPRISPKPTPRRLAMETEQAKRRQREAAKRRTGWASTIMTRGGNLGVATTGKATVTGA